MMNIEIINNLIKEACMLLKSKNKIELHRANIDVNYLLKILTQLANELLRYKDETVFCKYQYLQLWRKYTMNLEGDLLITVFLANQYSGVIEFDNRFDWKLVIDHDNEELNSILKEGIADNHYHLGGALPVFQCVWTEIMKNELYRKRIESLILDETQILKKAAEIRQYLIKFLVKQNKNLIEDINLKGFEKYYEERKLLFYIIQEFFRDCAMEISIKKIFCDYLIIKEWFRGFIVQCGNNIGENSFFTINDRKSICLKFNDKLDEIIKTSIKEQVESNHIRILEIRINMQASSFELYKYIKWLNDKVNYLDVKVYYIICFSRKITLYGDIKDRNWLKIVELDKQIKDLNIFLEEYPDIAKQVVGIDVCSKENNYRPEIFSSIMVRKENRIDAKLKRMYHVGEIYSDLLSGLRFIDECICFFKLGWGDRLGHAVPVFESVDEWYNERNKQIIIFKEDYLDNMAWLYCNLPFKVRKGKAGKKILRKFKYLFYELYKNVITDDAMFEFQSKDSKKINFENINIYHYFEAWKLRAENPEVIKKKLLKNIYNDESVIVYYIAYCHYYNSEIKHRGQDLVKIYITNEMLMLIQVVQKKLQDKIRNKGICIEVCPSSNILVGSIKEDYCHPLINIFKKTKNNLSGSNICVSINTDDQGIFATSLVSEYSLLINAFENKRDSNGDIIYSKEFLYNWINKIRENSIQMCCSDILNINKDKVIKN